MFKLKDFVYDGDGSFKIDKAPTNLKVDKKERPQYEEKLAENVQKLAELQDRFYADGREGLVVMIQAMDAAGKDGTIKHVLSGVNPQGVSVYSFKQPSKEELAHDYLWRAVCHLPERGKIGVFNRSYYEDVLVVRVHDMRKGYRMPKRCLDLPEKEFFAQRFRQISDFERHLYENGYRLVKIFLNISKEEQRKRFLARIDDEAKQWKFSAGDLDETALWAEYMKAFEETIEKTSTPQAPWYVVPADQKWVARLIVSEAIIKALEDCDSRYPEVSEEALAEMLEIKERLLAEK